MRYISTIGGTEFSIEVLEKGRVSVNGKVMDVDFENINGQPVYSMVIDGKSYEAYVYEGEEEWQVLLLGQQYPVQVEDEREKRLRRQQPAARLADAANSISRHPCRAWSSRLPWNRGSRLTRVPFWSSSNQ